MRTKILLFLFIAPFIMGAAQAENYWKTEGATTSTSMTVQGQKGTLFLSLIVSFSCRVKLGTSGFP